MLHTATVPDGHPKKMCLILQIRPEYSGDSVLATTSQGCPDKDLGTSWRKVGLLVPAATESGLSGQGHGRCITL